MENDAIKTSASPSPSKFVEIAATYNKENLLDKDNCRPETILYLISKVLEKTTY